MAVPSVMVEDVSRTLEQVPPLESGDRLTRREFERRYSVMPEVKKAELVEGVVYMGSPVRFESRGQPRAYIVGWLFVYCAATAGVFLGDNATVRLDPDNELQPDALLRLEPAHGGRSQLTSDDYVEGPPELVVEIAASSASYDMHDKLRVYRRNQVPEYMVWRIYDRALDWFSLQGEVYVRLAPDENGVVHSRVFPGLRLAVEALLAGNLAAVLATLQDALASEEHAAFVNRLNPQP